jgi:RNA polymerase sigma-70 factor (ECF subfamily)
MGDDGVRFGLLWGEAHLAVRGYILGLMRDPVSTDDLVQEVALAAFRSFKSYDPARSFTSWAIGVARHLVHQHWSTHGRQRMLVHDLAQIDEMAQMAVDIDEPVNEQREALNACLESVAGRSWDVIRMHYIEGVSTLDVAARLRLDVGHVRVLLHRIRNALRTCIERRLRTGQAHV